MIRALFLGKIAVTDRNQVSTAIGGACIVLLLILILRSWGWL